ncbi:MAG: SRPBCC family protein [Gemmatimonadaceae bacterium]|nr:SRPBCC family protein [Gemmatimonadaceae bacterium]
MSTSSPIAIDPQLDLVLERIVDLPRRLVWAAWTTPELLMPWFCPKPWLTTACRIDLQPGDRSTTMQSPDGESFPSSGCFLEVIPETRLTWTDALLPGFRPAAEPAGAGLNFRMTGCIMLEDHGTGTKYTALALHGGEAQRAQHDAMGSENGWGTALDQLVAHMTGR